MSSPCAPGCLCDCCVGIEPRTPRPLVNRQGLRQLRYRVGTHGDFLSSMVARLGNMAVDKREPLSVAAGVLGRILTGQSTPLHLPPEHPLSALTARTPDDPAIALLDAWAVVLDVLTFYEERIVNENYLRTATEFRSVLELARLIGYEPRPGVAASTYLAFTLEKGADLTVKLGNRAQSVPGSGEQPQSFETAENLAARETWNSLSPRRGRPQLFEPGLTTPGRRVWLKGLATQLKPNDPLVVMFDTSSGEAFRAKKVTPINASQTTQVVLQEFKQQPLMRGAAAIGLASDQVNQAIRGAFEAAANLLGPTTTAAIRLVAAVENVFAETTPETTPPTLKKNVVDAFKLYRPDVFLLLSEFTDFSRHFKNLLDKVGTETTGLDAPQLAQKLMEILSEFQQNLGVPFDRRQLVFLAAMALDRLQANFTMTMSGKIDGNDNKEITKRLADLLGWLGNGLKQLRIAIDAAADNSRISTLTRALVGRLEIVEDQLKINRSFDEVFGIDLTKIAVDPANLDLVGKIKETIEALQEAISPSMSPIEFANQLIHSVRETVSAATIAILTDEWKGELDSITEYNRIKKISFYCVVSILRSIMSRYVESNLSGVEKDTRIAENALERFTVLQAYLRPNFLLVNLYANALADFRTLQALIVAGPFFLEPLSKAIDDLAVKLNEATTKKKEPDEAMQDEFNRIFATFYRDLQGYKSKLRQIDDLVRNFIVKYSAAAFLQPSGSLILDTLLAKLIADLETNLDALEKIPARSTASKIKVPFLQALKDAEALADPAEVVKQILQVVKEFFENVWQPNWDAHVAVIASTERVLILNTPILPEVSTLTEQILPEVHKIVAGLRQDRRIAEAGNYPRVLPWLQETLEELERFLSDLALQPQEKSTSDTQQPDAPSPCLLADLAALRRPPARVPRNSARLMRQLPTAGSAGETGQAFSDMVPQLAVAFDPRLAGALYDALQNATTSRRQRFQGLFALRARASVFGFNASPRQFTGPNGTTTPLADWPLSSNSVDIQVFPIDMNAAQPFLNAFVEIRLTTSDGKPFFVRVNATTPSISYGTSPDDKIGVKLEADRVTVTVTGKIERKDIVIKAVVSNLTFTIDDPNLTFLQLVLGGLEDRVAQNDLGFLTYSYVEKPKKRVQITSVQTLRIDEQTRNILTLDAANDKVTPGSFVVIERPGGATPTVARVEAVAMASPNAYGLPATKVTRLTLDKAWLDPVKDRTIADIRDINVYLQSEKLELAGEPYDADVAAKSVELDDVVDGLTSGRWVIVAGERTDVAATTGVKGAELVMLQGASQIVDAQDTAGQGYSHTQITLESALAYTYQRGTVTIYGNVVKADQGETKQEILGSGDARAAGQKFLLKQSPLTYLAAPTPKGAVDTLQVRVDGVLWKEVESFLHAGPSDQCYFLRTDDQGKTTVWFGDGVRGARLPSGVDNVRASYRVGLGRSGNVGVGKISQLVSRPLGLKEVINPVAASGGADRESADSARRNAPMGVTALGRLVSVSDYADFARGFAGIEKAYAKRLSNGVTQQVHLTIAGRDGGEIDEHSELYRNFIEALRRQGDPAMPLQVAARRLRLLVLSAKVRVRPAYEFDPVVAAVRAQLYQALSFDQCDFGKAIILSDVIGVMHGVRGVQAVDIDAFDLIDEKLNDGTPTSLAQIIARLKEISGADTVESQLPVKTTYFLKNRIVPAELAFLSPAVPDLLILNEWKS